MGWFRDKLGLSPDAKMERNLEEFLIKSGDLVTIQKACELAAVSRRTLYNWMNSGRLPYIRTVGGARRIKAADLFIQEP